MLSNNKSAKNMYSEDRTRLIDAIPMDVPLCISIEPSNLCNFKCCMCYHGNNEYDDAAKPLKNMDMECFKKVINDIVEWTNKKATKIKLIKLYSLGEPLLHPEICNMVKIIKESDICEKIEITTNGSLLSKNIAKKLVDYGLDIIRFSIYGVSDEINRSVTKSKVTPCEIRQNIEYLKKYRDGEGKKIPIIHTKMLNTYSDENELFFDYYDGIADNIGLDEPFHLELGGQNDVFKNLYGDKADMVFEKSQGTNIYKNKKICRYPFTHLTIRSDGKVVLCCADWLKELTIGNVMDHSLEELWESKTLYNIRCGMIEQKGLQYKVCHNCEIPYRDMPEDNIDELTEDKLSFENDF